METQTKQSKKKGKILEAFTEAFQILSKPKSDLDFSQWLHIESKEIRNLERRRQLRDWREMENK